MKLSLEEERYLHHWMYDEMHYQQGAGPAKRLQLEHRAVPADLAMIIAAAIPDPVAQQAIGLGPPPAEQPQWPWPRSGLLEGRVAEAAVLLGVAEPSEHMGEDPRLRRCQ